MNCYLCGNKKLKETAYYDEPDKYLKVLTEKITDSRRWMYCSSCELYQNDNNLDENILERIYLKYRDHEMRGTTVENEFNRIIKIPFVESENKQRVLWLRQQIRDVGEMLDIGSGLGVFPYLMKKDPQIKEVYCIEREPESALFIDAKLGIPCISEMYGPGLASKAFYTDKFELVTLVHVLEHFPDPIKTLKQIRECELKPNGNLFIEVPDASEFDYLPRDHDEFNSLHFFFFNISTLDRTLRMAGFTPWLIKRVKYSQRNLSRIMAICSS